MENAKLVLVTGGSGYVGSVLVPLLAKRWPVRVLETMNFGNPIAGTPNVEFVQGDICEKAAVVGALEGVTDIIHLAGIVTDDLVDMNRGLALKVNVFATQQLCELAVRAGVERFIYASSSSVYGSSLEPVTEEARCAPETFYALTKLVAEQAALGFKDRISVTGVRSATSFGPAPRMRLDTIVNVFCKQAYYDGSITVHDGTQWRSNVHVEDAADFYALLLEADVSTVNGQVFNLVEHSRTALEIAREVKSASGMHALVISIDATKRDTRQYRMSGEKALKVLGWRPTRTIGDGVRDNIDFFRSGGITDPNDTIWYNTRRMEKVVKGAL